MPATTQDILRTSLEAAAEAIRTRRTSPVLLVESCLARIEAVGPRPHALITPPAPLPRRPTRPAAREVRAGGRKRAPPPGAPARGKLFSRQKGRPHPATR